MFTVGLGTTFNALFMLAALALAVPIAVKVFNWLATLRDGSIALDTPMLWALGFVTVVVFGGLTGIFLAVFPVNWDVSDSQFVVAHLHYMLLGGVALRRVRGADLLVAEAHRPDARRAARQGGLLARLPRLQRDVPAAVPARVDGHAAARLHVRFRGLWEAYNMVSTIGSYVIAAGLSCSSRT